MTIGGLGKVLANQAIESTKKTVMDAVNPANPPKTAKPAETSPPAPADVGAIVVGQIQAMQRPLREDQELRVTVRAGDEMLRITEILVPNAQVLIFVGTDAHGHVTRVISPVDMAQVVCKVMPVAGAGPVRVNVLTPKPQPRPGA